MCASVCGGGWEPCTTFSSDDATFNPRKPFGSALMTTPYGSNDTDPPLTHTYASKLTECERVMYWEDWDILEVEDKHKKTTSSSTN